MSKYTGRITDDNVTWFDRLGELRVIFGKGMTKFTSPSVQLGADDPGRVFSGNHQMNPIGKHVPSTVVSPQPTWTPVVPQLNIAMAMIFAMVAVANDIEDSVNDGSQGSLLGRPLRKKNFQIVDFEDFLPENVS